MQRSFLSETRNLAELSGNPSIPRLLFAYEKANPCEFPYIIGIEYRKGKPILEWPIDLKNGLTPENRQQLEIALKETLSELHLKYGYAHGDLSPRNILAHFEPENAQPWYLTVIDWEFGEKLTQQNLKTYDHFRGTLGFVDLNQTEDPISKDWRALRACLKFLGFESNNTPTKARKWFKWI